jgi:hypothetical protein
MLNRLRQDNCCIQTRGKLMYNAVFSGEWLRRRNACNVGYLMLRKIFFVEEMKAENPVMLGHKQKLKPRNREFAGSIRAFSCLLRCS